MANVDVDFHDYTGLNRFLFRLFRERERERERKGEKETER